MNRKEFIDLLIMLDSNNESVFHFSTIPSLPLIATMTAAHCFIYPSDRPWNDVQRSRDEIRKQFKRK